MPIAKSYFATYLATVSVFAALIAACSSLVDVHEPDAIQPGSLASAAGADALRAGAMGRFASAITGYWIRYLGLRTDELFFSQTGGHPLDQRLPVELADHITSQARQDALLAIASYEQYAPSQRVKIGHMFALVAYTEIMQAESLCSGQPLSQVENGVLVYGAPMTNAQLFTQAMADADSALIYSGTDAQVGNLARVVKARALLGLGSTSFDAAAAAVATVPTNFVHQTENGSSVQMNETAAGWTPGRTQQYTVADREGINGLDFRSANDPRVPVTFISKGVDGKTDVYAFKKYTSPASPVVIASGIEARLIEAEDQLKNGQAAAALATLNAARSTMAGLAPLTLQPTAAGQVYQLFRERAFWLFLTGHRFGDMRRLIRQYGRGAETVFPTGAYRDGLTYGSEVPFILRAAEAYNPNTSGGACLDKNP
jgi:hypothetical protein